MAGSGLVPLRDDAATKRVGKVGATRLFSFLRRNVQSVLGAR